MNHRSTNEMSPYDLEVCGCDRCQDALRLHAKLDELIASSAETDAAFARLEASVSSLELRHDDERLRSFLRRQRGASSPSSGEAR